MSGQLPHAYILIPPETTLAIIDLLFQLFIRRSTASASLRQGYRFMKTIFHGR